jgi:hypothetical protein
MKSRLLAILIVASLSLSLPTIPVFAASAESGSDSAGAPPVVKMFITNLARLIVLKSELGITNEQRDKIKSTVKAHAVEARAAAKSVVERKRALREAVLNQDEANIKKASAELGTAISNAALLASKVIGEARPALTEGQIDKIAKFRAAADKEQDSWLDQIGK